MAVPLMSFTIDGMALLGTKISSTLAVLCAVAVLGACGTESGTEQSAADPTSASSPEPGSESSSASPEPGALPECADVWVDGEDLPKDYKACTTDGETIKPVKRACGYGAKFLEHDGRYFAMLGNRITDAGDLETNEDYQQLLATCQA